MKVETILLRLTFIAFGIFCLFILIVPVPNLLTDEAKEYSDYLQYIGVGGIYLGAISLFYGLLQGFKILNNIDKDKKITKDSLKLLNEIRYCSVITGILFMSIIPFFYMVADKEDAPGLIIMGTILCAIPIGFGIFVSLMYRLFSIK